MIVITPPPKQPQRVAEEGAVSMDIDGQSIVGANGEVIMYCDNPEAALRYLKRVCREE